MNKKNIIIIIIIVVLLIVMGITGYFLLTKNDKITISFNTQYDYEINNIKITKGEKIELPVLTRDGYVFLGWYSNNQEIDDDYIFSKSTTLEARWKKDDNDEPLDFKPLLYLYPMNKTNITVTFPSNKILTTTYPKYIDSWKVTAYPNGDLIDKEGNYYYGLYWEAISNYKVSFNEGFYVDKENALSFLEDKLSIIGLSPKERNEFIMYWLPILENNEKNLVYFELTNERNSHDQIIINPKPDSYLRVYIHVKKVNNKVNIKEEKLDTFNRVGYVAVEWGGIIY